MGGDEDEDDDDEALIASNEELKDEVNRMLAEMLDLKQQLAEIEQEKREEARRQEEQRFIQSRTRMQMATATRTTATGTAGRAVLTNPLFANAGSARRIGFAIDISGSMQSSTQAGSSRIEVVKRHLASAIRSMSGAPGAAFGVALFDTGVKLPLGDRLLPCNRAMIARGMSAISGIKADGGNGGEAACLRSLLKMKPDAVFFLGDGGWDSGSLIKAAGEAASKSVTIHSIAFFTTGGGLPEIAAVTGDTYRELNTVEGLDDG